MAYRKPTTPLFIALSLALLVLLTLGAAGAAAGMERFHPVPGIVKAPALPIPVRDAVVRGGAAASRVVVPGAGDTAERAFTTTGGNNVRISASTDYAPDPGADQELANFLGSLDHGSELNALRVKVETELGIAHSCGEGTVACYYPSADLMVVSGEDSFGGVPTSYAIAHEYGHHIANHRHNRGLHGGALTWGTRRWFVHEDVLAKVRHGTLSVAPNAYWNYPGENYAEAYAVSQTGAVTGWWYAPCLKPDASAMRAIRKDVMRPWAPYGSQLSAAGQISR